MSKEKKSSNVVAIVTMCFIFAMISFVTNMAAPFGNIWKGQYSWAGMMGNMMNFAAYLFMGIPAGKMLLKIGYKKTTLAALAVGFIGICIEYLSSFEFVGGAAIYVYLLGAFVCGFCVCMLNTVVNPMQSIREYLIEKGFIEVETPTLQPIYGGANARPFTTHHNACDMTLYLRVAPELYLKRCIVGGMEKVFEFSKNFRNEGMDRTHSPEFTGLEFYEAFADYNDMMVHFENIYERACIAANGTTKINYQGREIDFKAPWPRYSMIEAIEKFGGLKVNEMSDEDIKNKMEELGGHLDGEFSRGRGILELFELTVEEKLIQPTFIKDMPTESTPLCKKHRTTEGLIEQFEPYCNGWELGNAYTELNDPIRQRELLEDQVRRGRGGEGETHPMDENFMHAIESGLPPTGGVGFGIDRMIMLLTNQETIRDVQLFPLMKPEV